MIGWMIAPPAMAMINRMMARIRSMQADYPNTLVVHATGQR
jgi:hypothetical protein